MYARIIAIAAVLFIGAAGLASALQTGGDKKKEEVPKGKEPEKITAKTEVNGKTLDQWIDLIAQEKKKDKDRSLTEIAIKTVLLYPPTLIAELRKHSTVNPIDMSVRVNASVALGTILGAAKDPHRNPNDPKQKDPADPKKERDLVKEAVDVLKAMLNDKQVIVRYRAAQALAQMGPNAKAATINLCEMTKDGETWETRYQAVVTLGSVAWEKDTAPPDQVFANLYRELSSDKESALRIRLAALMSLSRLNAGRFDKANFSAKLKTMAVKDPDTIAKLRAQLTLWPLLTGKDDRETADLRKPHFEALHKFLDSPDIEARLELVTALGSVAIEKEGKAPPVKGLVDILFEALGKDTKSEKSVPIRMAALAALKNLKLGDFKGYESMYQAKLDDLADTDPDSLIKLNARMHGFALLKSPQAKQRSIQSLVKFLDNPDINVRVETTKAIADLGKEAKDAIPKLIQGLTDKDLYYAHWCIMALAHMESEGKPAVNPLKKISEDPMMPLEMRETAHDAISIIEGRTKLPGKEEPKKGGERQ
jgi:HEAT repeat protein